MAGLERHVRLMLQSGKTMAQAGSVMKAGDIAVIVITVIIFAIFVVGMASICYRWSFYQFDSRDQSVNRFTDSDLVDFRTERSLSITVARGIEPAIVESFPTFLYSEVKERKVGKGGVECAVCLCDFQDNEALRFMPNCCHVFHADCVSAWLSNHSTCPLCRLELVFQPGEGTELVPDPDSTDGDLLQGVTWIDANRLYLSVSTRLTDCRVSEILYSRSHSTGHCVVQPVQNFDRFKFRLPDDVRRELMAVDHVRTPRRVYRSRSVGSDRTVLSNHRSNYNNLRLHSRTFSFSDCRWANSCGGDPMPSSKSLPRSIHSGERSLERVHPDDQA